MAEIINRELGQACKHSTMTMQDTKYKKWADDGVVHSMSKSIIFYYVLLV